MQQERDTVPRHQAGITRIEILAVVITLGVLTAVGTPRYLDLAGGVRDQAVKGHMAEVNGRLSSALAKYMLDNQGSIPRNGSDLLEFSSKQTQIFCPSSPTREGDFTYSCIGDPQAPRVIIKVSAVGDAGLAQANTTSFNF